MANIFPEISAINLALGVKMQDLSFEKMCVVFHHLNPNDKNKVLLLTKNILMKKSISCKKYLNIRMAACILLLVGMPDSRETLNAIMLSKRLAREDEVHFTLFCWVDDFDNCVKTRKHLPELMEMIKEYLFSVHLRGKSAPRMAAATLAELSDQDHTIPILFDVAKNAKYIIGRETALNGLFWYLIISKGKSKYATQIRKFLTQRLKQEKNPKLRRSVKFLLEQYFN